MRSLCRDHRLTPVEVGKALRRDKSWVSRRLMLAERLEGVLQDDIRLGLLAPTVARELASLPRGNQAFVRLQRELPALRDEELPGRRHDRARGRSVSRRRARGADARAGGARSEPRARRLPEPARAEMPWVQTARFPRASH